MQWFKYKYFNLPNKYFYNYIKHIMNNYDLLVKLIIIGNSGVGKTNILLKACDDRLAC